MSIVTPNPAPIWAAAFVDALIGAGVSAVCISPGSRSTALALAFAARPELPRYVLLDERGAAFFALGMVQATQRPVALLCTSGTAAANYFPALIEARMAQHPLIFLTADRPPELRHSGANQTIDQLKLYGDQPLWFVDVALPDSAAPASAIRNLRALAARAVAVADGIVKGPVHLNFPFRPPFEPDRAEDMAYAGDPVVAIERGALLPTADQCRRLAALIGRCERGLIICGPRCPGDEFPLEALRLAEETGFPLLADPLSGLRFGPWTANNPLLIAGYEGFLRPGGPEFEAPELVIRFGAIPTSKQLAGFLERRPAQQVIHVRENGVWADDTHAVSHFLQVNESAFCRLVRAQLPARQRAQTPSRWAERFAAVEAAYWSAVEEEAPALLWDGGAVMDVLASLPGDALLFAGNSLPIRHIDQFGRPRERGLQVFANRGASGIDGNLSTALGLAAASGKPVTALLGDITLYHDLNALFLTRRHGLQATIVALNNDGGGIFRRLPVRDYAPEFSELFIVPHGLAFAHAAAMFGAKYVRGDSITSFREALIISRQSAEPMLIEVSTAGDMDAAHYQQLTSRVLRRVRHL